MYILFLFWYECAILFYSTYGIFLMQYMLMLVLNLVEKDVYMDVCMYVMLRMIKIRMMIMLLKRCCYYYV